MRSTLCFLGQGEGTGIDKAWIRDSQNNNMRNRILHGKCRLVPSYLAMIKPAPDGKFKRRQCSINGNEQGSAMGLDFFPGPLVWASPCCQGMSLTAGFTFSVCCRVLETGSFGPSHTFIPPCGQHHTPMLSARLADYRNCSFCIQQNFSPNPTPAGC